MKIAHSNVGLIGIFIMYVQFLVRKPRPREAVSFLKPPQLPSILRTDVEPEPKTPEDRLSVFQQEWSLSRGMVAPEGISNEKLRSIGRRRGKDNQKEQIKKSTIALAGIAQ